jgi:lantibiotic modifying enzyme
VSFLLAKSNRRDASLQAQDRAWQPLLDGTWRERALEAVRAVADSLRAGWPASAARGSAVDASLAGGAAGLAVLFAYLGEAQRESADQTAAQQWLARAVQAVSEVEAPASLYSGLTGVAWVAAHLREQFPDLDIEPIGDEIDEVLLEHLERSPWPDTYDLIDGLVGFGVYALERLAVGADAARLAAVACLESVIDHLAETAERRPEGIAWVSCSEWLPPDLREKHPARCYNLGLAHGIPGVIALLGRACAAGVAVEKAWPLLEGAARWLMVRRAMVGTDGFPYCIEPGLPSVPARLAWCYGDPGMAAALLLAARCTGEPAWERAALAVARRAARRPPDEAEVVDAGLCHGAAGLGHLFNRLFQATGEPRLRDAARFWLQRTLELRQPDRGLAGFATWNPGPEESLGWTADPGFLTGAAGIALALLAAVTPIEPAWDRVLLVSIPPTPAAP